MADGSFTEHTNLEKISTVRRTVTPTQELKGLVVAKAPELNHYSPFVIDCRCCSAACNQTKQSALSSGFQWDTANAVSFLEELLLVFFSLRKDNLLQDIMSIDEQFPSGPEKASGQAFLGM